MTRALRTAVAATLALAALVAAGCSERIAATPLDSTRAMDSLKAALEAWKKGEPADALKSGSPPIVAQDLDWQGGATLVDYAIDGPGDRVDSNLKVPVKLTLKARSRSGKDVTKAVKYLVTTSPSITVFRAFP